ncbi:exodeoxyribonuclease 7 large subunit [Clostridium aceticum]|uniref:Exodeoxyribonuclease 7 large subunit n=1 Tax=Clostridium aceticum TaxID=84022 RepID=A0A0D8IFZ3_9CLOT|nr:exodeoxyribonuclease VII large subunit [Clostridium aceticum]AKL95301.1 exodeoxyribonuclease 7 large subunit [Clostridium aceticum]KJF28146.1 exodeoxyribonuclease VII large subunit [Clostridium aceticum]
MEVKTLSVSEITQYIKRLLTSDPILCNIHVEGEISNFKLHSSGHIYFTLKDPYSRIPCVMFKSNADHLKISPKDGMKVVIKGYISLYERDGQYQLYVQEMKSAGLGNLHIAFQQLKDSLQKEGLFDAKYKKTLPFIPQKIGIITSPTGAAIRDLLSIIKRRFPKVNLSIFPVLVQGDQAAASIVKAIELCNTYEDIEVIILGRGGGSIEELWAFNEEVVARAIFHSRIPIISAVGHETDFTIADFVADVRAQTPSAAAELVLPQWRDVMETLNVLERRLLFSMNTRLSQEKQRLETIKNNYYFKYPLNSVYDQKQYIDQLYKNLNRAISQKIFLNKENLRNTVERLNSLNPLSIFSRGYAVVTDPQGKNIKSITEVQEDELIKIRLLDGSIMTKVMQVKKEDRSREKDKL